MTTTRFAEKIRSMEMLVSNLTPVLDEVPESRDKHGALHGVVVRAKQLDDEEEQLRGKLREKTAQRRELTAEGSRIRREVVAVLQAHYGFDNEQLIQFGIRPQARTKRKVAAQVRDGAKQAVTDAARKEDGGIAEA